MPDLQAGLPSGTSVWCQPGERFNTWSHLAALLVGVVASVGLICETVAGGDARKIAGSVMFGLSLAALFGASALFHGCTGARKRFWQRVDHACIYLLIAGSHTPFALMAPPGLWAWLLLGGVWGLAFQGAIRALGFDSPPRLSLYISLGWLSLGGAVPMALRHGAQTLAWLLAGGLLYSAGTVFYRSLSRMRHSHGIWHLFVVAGSACHTVAVVGLLA